MARTLQLAYPAKLALYRAMREQRIGNVAPARRLGTAEGTIRRLLDLDHRSHIGHVETVLRALGQRLVVEARAAWPTSPRRILMP